MKKTTFTAGLFRPGQAEAMKRQSARTNLRQGIEAFGDINNILSITPREQADMILLRDMLVHDAKAGMGLRLFADEGMNPTDAEFALATTEGSAFTLVEQFEIGLPLAIEFHKELKELRAKSGSRAAATERAEAIVTEYKLDEAMADASHTEVKKKVRDLLMRDYIDADYDAMRTYLSGDTRNPSSNEVEEAAALTLQLAQYRLNKAGMNTISSMCGYTTDNGKTEPSVIDLYDEMHASPMRIDAMPAAHESNKKIIKKCQEALPGLRETAEMLKKRFPDAEIAKAYKVPSRELFRAAEQAIETMPNKEPLKGAFERMGSIDESTILSSDTPLNVELGARIDNAAGIARSMVGASATYADDNGKSLGRSIRPFRNKLSDADDEAKVRAKLLKGGGVSVEQQDAIVTFRALDTMFDTYLDVGRQEVEHIKRIRTDYADKLSGPQNQLLDQLEADYAIVLEHVPKTQLPLATAHQNIMEGLHEDDYYIGRYKVESLVRYLEGFLEAAERREKKFEKFEEKHPPKKVMLAAS